MEFHTQIFIGPNVPVSEPIRLEYQPGALPQKCHARINAEQGKMPCCSARDVEIVSDTETALRPYQT
jgi:hypothetical protein